MRLGSWQRDVLHTLKTEEAPLNPLRALKGKADKYWGRYKDSLRSLEAKGLIKPAKGPRGGVAWELTEAGDFFVQEKLITR